jgi:hypothetical protein
MFTAMILMCSIDNTMCWPYVNSNLVETEEMCKYTMSLALQSSDMMSLLDQGWHPESYRCINWKEESA